jgi:hypothetical protein
VFQPVQKARCVYAVRPFIVVVGQLPISFQREQYTVEETVVVYRVCEE